MTSIQKSQELLDEYKQQIPDELYRKLCELNLSSYQEEKKQKNLYRVRYVMPTHHYDDCMNHIIDPKISTRIVEIPAIFIEKIKRNITDDGFCYSKFCQRIDGDYKSCTIIPKNHSNIVEVERESGEAHQVMLEMRPIVISIEEI